jgi:dihydropyrimidinase
MIILARCENGRAIDLLTRQLVAQGRLGLDSLPRSRPIALEAECVHRFLALAEVAGATPYVVHVTGARPLAEIAAARRRGMRVHAEVCPHHLRFERARHEGDNGLRYVMTPPLRTAADRAALMRGLQDGALDTYASDHCHLRLDRDKQPVAHDFTKVPTGLPGIGARFPLGFAAAVEGEAPLSPQRLVEVACAAPARIFGLYPQKGAVASGSDADVVVWDPSRPSRITLAGLDDGLGWSPYEGLDVPGSIRFVFARGDPVVEEGRLIGGDHRGAYLPVGRVSAPGRRSVNTPSNRRRP